MIFALEIEALAWLINSIYEQLSTNDTNIPLTDLDPEHVQDLRESKGYRYRLDMSLGV